MPTLRLLFDWSLYRLALLLAAPLIPLRLLWRGRRERGYLKHWGERLALGPAPATGALWIHAVSVGEMRAAQPLIQALRDAHPDAPLLLTCMTPTGRATAESLYGSFARIVYLPYDYAGSMHRFMRRARPRVGILMETELWPNLVHAAARGQVPIVLANARLSERSARGYARFAGLTGPMLAEMNLIAVQTEVEAERFRSLGARPECVQVTGSIKFDLKIDEQLQPRAKALREQWGAEQRPVWIAASTHEGEDALILEAHRQLLQVHGDALLILVPRHPERFDAVYALCRDQFATVRRSLGTPVNGQTAVLLGDTMGELLFLYALADIAFVGGSLVATGGHNPLEPAALALPVVMGPHVFNFLEITAMLREAGALQQVDDAEGLAGAIRRLIELPQDARRMGLAGKAVMQANQGALDRLVQALAKWL